MKVVAIVIIRTKRIGMAAIEASHIPEQERAGLCCVYASLILHDGGKKIAVGSRC